MRGALPLFRFRGIQLLVHWTFLLLPGYVVLMGYSEGTPWHDLLVEVGFVLLVFLCVVLHEFGHALTAQHYGVGTKNITLLPIGGVASLERMPEDPRQEFWITVAGPLVNLVIAGIAFALISISGITLLLSEGFQDLTSWNSVLTFLFLANLSLFLFNLLPAFPMDGGRILRSLLSMRLPRERATRIATTVGRVFAVGFMAFGLLRGQPFLAIIGFFIFMAAGAEAKAVRQRYQTRSVRVRERMRTGPISMAPWATVQDAWNAMTMVDHRILLVMDNGVLAGIHHREALRQLLMDKGGTTPIGRGEAPLISVSAEDPAFDLYQRMLQEGFSAAVVVDAGRVIGTIEKRDLENAFGPVAHGPTLPVSSGYAG